MNRENTQKKEFILYIIFALVSFAAVTSVICFFFIGQNAVPSMSEIKTDTGRRDGYYTFLVGGVDRISNNTDVLMLVSLDTKTCEVKILQLPRDTYVSKAVTGYKSVSRINGIFAAEYNAARTENLSSEASQKRAMEHLKSTLSDAFATDIDEYILVNISMFREIVDEVGGVDFDVPYDMDYEDPEQDLYIHLKAGYQHLDGAHAEQLIRFREPTKADLGRMNIRAGFMIAMAKQVKEKLSISTVLSLVNKFMDKNRAQTSVGLFEAIKYARAIYKVPLDSISVKTITGSSVYDVNTGAWSPSYYLNRYAACRDVNEFINANKNDISLADFDANGLFHDKDNVSADTYYRWEEIKYDTDE